jgi:ketosteroid isomerase-like protein
MGVISANAEIVRAWIRAINGRDPEEPVALVTPDFELVESSTLPGAARAVGLEGLREYGAGWTRNWSEWEMREVELVEIPPTHVVLVADLSLRGRGSGIEVERRWVYLFQIRGDKLASQLGYDDKEEALRAGRAA